MFIRLYVYVFTRASHSFVRQALDRLLSYYDYPWNEQSGSGSGTRGIYVCAGLAFITYPNVCSLTRPSRSLAGGAKNDVLRPTRRRCHQDSPHDVEVTSNVWRFFLTRI